MSHPWPVSPDQLESASESDQASLSPRTALLSPPFEDVGLDDLPTRVPRGPGVKFRHERQRAHSTASPRELLEMLVSEEYESKQTRKILYTAFDRLEYETKRADTAEARIDETIQRARAINDARIAAQQQAVRVQEELKLYKMQLDNAQKEILRAQDVLKAVEAQRDEAEAAAVSARSKARRLNEERLIELAREEGRRLGFEEGVRRGRRMGYREAYSARVDDRRDDMAIAVVDRLLEDRDEPEEIEVLEESRPTPIPPPSSSRTAPEVHRLETPINSSLENQRHGSHSGRDSLESAGRITPRPVIPAPEIVDPRIISAGPPSGPSFSRPASVQNSPPSVRHAEFHVPPDNYIPIADANNNISLPPPHEMQRSVSSPTPSQRTLGQTSERGRGRDYMYDNYPLPRRGSPDESLASTKQSAASTISQLDIVGLPTSSRRRDRPHGLSVIQEDASMRSERMTGYSQTAASASEAGRSSFQDTGSSETLRRDSKSKRQLADELRYSDPSTAEQWRQQADSSRSQRSQAGPPRPRPSQITVPTPLSPPRVLQQQDVRVRRTPSERQGRSETRSEYRDQRRPLSSDSSVPEINVEPPSGPPSDAPSRGRVNVHGLLSPDHANLPLPIPGAPASNGRSSPAPGSPGPRQGNMSEQTYTDGQFPSGFLASPTVSAPFQAPVIPQNTGGGAPPQRYSVPYGAPSSDRESGRSRSPISFYVPSSVPAGVVYPPPPISRPPSRPPSYAAYTPSAESNPSVTSEGGRRRGSIGATAGMTPAPRTKPIQTAGSAADSVGGSMRDLRGSRRQSTTSLASDRSRPHNSRIDRSMSMASDWSRPHNSRRDTGMSYSRYDPEMYNDPALLASSESFADPVTDANTAANGGGPVRHVRVYESPESYLPLRTNA